MRGLEGVWRGASRHQSLIICLPISLFFSTIPFGGSYHLSLFYYSSFDEWGVWRRKEKCGADEKYGLDDVFE